MKWVLVIFVVLQGGANPRLGIRSTMPDKETCYEALGNVQHELIGPTSSDNTRALGMFVAACVVDN